jgi:diguanylate cyclase (GGDEF)-like protein
VNDALGHHVGDRLLKLVAERLGGLVREIDTVARLGGDEFAILQAEVARPEDAFDLAARVVAAVAEPFEVDGKSITTSTSIGIALHPTDGADVDELLKSADLAMYGAKAEGRNTYRLFAAHMNDTAREEIVLDADLRQALARGEFVLHYQPRSTFAPAGSSAPRPCCGGTGGPGTGGSRRVPPLRRGARPHHPDQRVGAAGGLPGGARLGWTRACRRCASP